MNVLVADACLNRGVPLNRPPASAGSQAGESGEVLGRPDDELPMNAKHQVDEFGLGFRHGNALGNGSSTTAES